MRRVPFTTLIDTAKLAGHLDDPAWAIVDGRFSLADPDYGEREYLARHIPGAVFAHLDRDLAGPVVPGRTGRHPLPDVATFGRTLGGWGIGAGVQVVAYDDLGGAFAARLWWLLRWLGHAEVAVLSGGWPRWLAEDRPVRAGRESRSPRTFVPRPRPELVVDAAEVDDIRLDPAWRLLDARAADRFAGRNETIDPVAGHIPGAASAPFAENLAADGRFLSPGDLRARYAGLLGGIPPERTVATCGSGVTAAHLLLALAYAGLGEARLYAGSWSEWITDPDRPVATEDPEASEGG
jgi:thiosulfate/3-mercaptopyruvate sulfurtransferase